MIHGIVNVLKPSAMSSHDVVGRVRHIFGMKKVGHAGTLDPLAAGVLPVFLGQATRLIEYSGDDDKTYRAEFVFDFTTDTEDYTGTVVSQSDAPQPVKEELEAVLKEFVGAGKQRPSKYSAISINGVKAYKLARQNKEFELPDRDIYIDGVTLLAYDGYRAVIEVDCSKGTYIRSLIRDIGERLGTQAVMTGLLRMRVGNFSISEAATLEELAAEKEKFLLPIDAALPHMAATTCSKDQYAALLQGRPVPFAGRGLADGEVVRIYDPMHIMVGVGTFDVSHHILRPHKMFSGER